MFFKKKKDEEWKNISNDAKDLISKMLDINPDTRLSAKEAIDHIWFEKNKSNDFLDDKCMENLTKFSVIFDIYLFNMIIKYKN